MKKKTSVAKGGARLQESREAGREEAVGHRAGEEGADSAATPERARRRPPPALRTRHARDSKTDQLKHTHTPMRAV